MENRASGAHPDSYLALNRMPNRSKEKDEGRSYYAKKDAEATASNTTVDDSSKVQVLETEREIATNVMIVDDDPSLNPWTFRSVFLGLVLSSFGSSLAQIYYFKPQIVSASVMFFAIVSYILGLAMETFIPCHGAFHFFNPHPFNKKENAFILIMASAAANSAFATDVLAVQRLYYNITLGVGTSVCLLFSSQLLGYGVGGLLRSTLLYPSKMLYPQIIPVITMFDALFHDTADDHRRLKVFYFVFGAIFLWEFFPEWIFPLLTGVSIFCLAVPNNAIVSRVFGGTNGNEGLGILSICFDWQYISAGNNPMTIPLKAQFSSLIGHILSLAVFAGVYYSNIWKSQNFPFLSQLLYYENGTVYNQTSILDSNYEVDPTLLAKQGLPYFAGTGVVNLIATNMGLAAAFTHLLLWNYDDLRPAWSWMAPSNLRKWYQEFSWKNVDWKIWQHDGILEHKGEDLDPHHAQMLEYPDAPNSWYRVTFTVSFAVALAVIYKTKSTLPLWSFVISVLLAIVSVIFFGAIYAITGVGITNHNLAQTIAGYLNPGRPMANMYFVLYSYNTATQANLLLRDLKMGQYAKLPPRASFFAQIIGTLLGALVNYIVMNTIINNQFEILLSVQGTDIWSGQQPQQFNSAAIAWGGLSHHLFSLGMRYQWVPLAYLIGLAAPVPFWMIHKYWPKLSADYLYLPIICTIIGWGSSGINSSSTSAFMVAFLSQWWMRTRHPRWFKRYNYLVSAALDAGTQVVVFILSFAVDGAAGPARPFPSWWGANQGGNYDHCLYLN